MSRQSLADALSWLRPGIVFLQIETMATPPEDVRKPEEDFLSRWSQRKQQAREEAAAADKASPAKVQSEEPPPKLPPVEDLTMDSDYSGFFHPKVNEEMRRSAMKKLFSDPHFNVMDGLDIYIDDYSISEPIPAAMLKELKQAQNILDWARERRENEAERERQAGLAAPGQNPPPALDAADEPAAATAPEAAAPAVEETVRKPPPEGPQTA